MIECRNLSKKYGETLAVDSVSLNFENGSLNMLIGPSGCGKTTILKMLNRLVEKNSGEIFFDGQSIDEHDVIELRRSIGYVIQETGLFPHFTIYDNIAVVPRLLHWKEARIKQRVDELMDLVNLDPELYLHKYPAQLSGGQRQRVGVARALAADPKVLLMDEPFGAIDPLNREQLQNGFLEIQQQIKKTVVFVTHDIREAIKLGDTISILRQGRLIQHGPTADVLQEPADAFVEDLLGADRALKGLELQRVRDYYDQNFISVNSDERQESAAVLQLLEKKGHSYAFVCDRKNRLQGYLLAKDLRRNPEQRDLKALLHQTASIQPFGNVLEAVSLMMGQGLSSLPVVDDHQHMLGLLRFSTVLSKLGEASGNQSPSSPPEASQSRVLETESAA